MNWTAAMVSDTDIPAAAIRNYLEQSLVRQVLGEVTKGDKFGAIADVGAGYGRLSCVLQEFSDNVFAIEREAELRRIGNSLNPNVVFLPVETLSNIPLVDASGLLGVPTRPDRLANRVLIVRCDFGSDAPISTAGLWVRGVIDLERLDFSSAGSHPGFATDSGRFLGPIVQSQWGQVQLVKPADLFTPEQAAVLTERLKPEAA